MAEPPGDGTDELSTLFRQEALDRQLADEEWDGSLDVRPPSGRLLAAALALLTALGIGLALMGWRQPSPRAHPESTRDVRPPR